MTKDWVKWILGLVFIATLTLVSVGWGRISELEQKASANEVSHKYMIIQLEDIKKGQDYLINRIDELTKEKRNAFIPFSK